MKKNLIIGAGEAGQKVLEEIRKHPELKLKVVGFIDDDPAKQKKEINQLAVLGTRKELTRIVKKNRVKEVIIALPSAHGEVVADVIHQLSKIDVGYKIVPRVREIIEEKVSINRIRDVQPEDLLGRTVVKADIKEISHFLKGKKVLVTGGAGSIGSEIARQVAAYRVREVLVFDWWENGLFELNEEIKNSFPGLKMVPIVGSIRDRNKVKWVMEKYRPQIVFHAAAFKHVPLMENNPSEAVKNNVLGTKNVAEEAKKNKVSHFVFLSTDKATHPRGVMGATKAVAESLIAQLASRGKTKFVVVRFGNVLGSYGSLLPLFKQQVASGGPVTVTHPKMRRYFMTISEATHLVLKAAASGENKELFILKMGEPIKIVDFARHLIRLSGLVPGRDIKIKFIGRRPGEKIQEKLLTQKEKLSANSEEEFHRVSLTGSELRRLKQSIKCLKIYAQQEDNQAILREFEKLFPSSFAKK